MTAKSKKAFSSPVAVVAKKYHDNVYPKLDSIRGAWTFYNKLKDFNLYLTELPFETSNPGQFKNHLVSEKAFLDRFYSLVDKDTVFADVGAYRGIYSFLAASQGASSYCFEITENNYTEIQDTIQENPELDVTAERKAVWSEENSSVKVPDSGDGQSSVGEGDNTVPSVCLDSYFKDKSDPDVIKIDVEGAEGQVIKGAERILKESRPIILLEIHLDGRVEKFGYSSRQVKLILKEKGYSLQYLESRGREEMLLALPLEETDICQVCGSEADFQAPMNDEMVCRECGGVLDA